jgi:predicted esterase YcpF (UPF0227 family)
VSDPYHILYLHGFRSSSASSKVKVFQNWLERQHLPCRLVSPDLPPSPSDSVTLAAKWLTDSSKKWCGVVGSSLGGYYAAAVADRFLLPAVLVNPAAYPYRLFEDYLGTHTNLYTGESFELKPSYLAELENLDVQCPRHPERLLMLLQTSDATLNYQEALQKYPSSPAWIMPGGRHEFDGFERVLPAIVSFFHSFMHRADVASSRPEQGTSHNKVT